MRYAVIERSPTTPLGTFGSLTTDDGWNCKTLELPWHNNENQISSVLPGAYVCEWKESPKHGWCYHLQSVPSRSFVEIHPANFAADSDLNGMECDLLGCIGLGSNIAEIRNRYGNMQKAITNSKTTVNEFCTHMGHQAFILIIKEATNNG